MDLGLGFYMRKLLLVLTCLSLTTSCMKKLSEDDSDGPVANATDVQQSLLKAWGNVDPATIQKNEFMYIEKEQKIHDYPAKVVMQEGITVADRQIDTANDQIVYTLLHQINDLSGEESKLSTTEEKIAVPNTQSLVAETMGDLQTAGVHERDEHGEVKQLNLGIQTIQNMLMACVKGADWNVSCHNLKYREELRAAPEYYQNQPNCGGLANCKIRVRIVSFDMIVTTQTNQSTAQKQKVQYTIATSPDVPYLSRLMDFCYRGLVYVPAAGQKILVSMCSYVRGLKPGQN